MLRANGIVPRKSEPQDHILDNLPVSETSLGKGLGQQLESKLKREAESGPESDDLDSDEDSLREKVLLVSF